MKQFIQNIKNAIIKFKLRYSKNDDGLYLFFTNDPKNTLEDNMVYINTAIPQNIVLKKRNKKGEYEVVEVAVMKEWDRKTFTFPAKGDYVIYIPKANRITKLSLDYSTVTNSLTDFVEMTSLTLLSLTETNVHGNINDLKKLPFLQQLYVSPKYIKGIDEHTFDNWHNLYIHKVVD